MKRYLSMLVLLAVVSTIAFAPATALAANDPAASQVIETIHLNQATAEQLQSLPGVARHYRSVSLIIARSMGPSVPWTN